MTKNNTNMNTNKSSKSKLGEKILGAVLALGCILLGIFIIKKSSKLAKATAKAKANDTSLEKEIIDCTNNL